MTACLSQTDYRALIADRLVDHEEETLLAHLSTCEVCQQQFEQLLRTDHADWATWRQLARTSLPNADQPQHVQEDASLREHFATCGYTDISEIGRGGMGLVYRAYQRSLQREIAIKVLAAGALAGPERLNRITAEARALAQLRHENIVRIYDVNHFRQLPYLILEYISDGSLATRLENGPLTNHAAAEIIRSVALAAAHAHDLGIIHRDIKPANILFSGATPRLADFGLAKFSNQDSSLTGNALVGTPAYMAPEQSHTEQAVISPATDVYALGTVLYESICGAPPFRSPNPAETLRRIAEEPPIRPRRIQPSVSVDLETICLKCLEKAPQDRYTNADQLADDLNRYLRDEPIQAKPPSSIKRVSSWARRSPLLAMLSVASLLLLVITISVWLRFTVELKQERDQTRQQADFANENFLRAQQALHNYLESFRTHTPVGSTSNLLFQEKTIETGLNFYDELIKSSVGHEHHPYFNINNLHRTKLDYAALLIEYAKVKSVAKKHKESLQAYHQASLVCQQVAQESPDDFREATRLHCAALVSSISTTATARGTKAAITIANQGLELNQRLEAPGPNAASNANWYQSIGLCKLAQVYAQQSDYSSACQTLEQAAKFANYLPRVPDYRLTLAQIELEFTRLAREFGDQEIAKKHCLTSIDLLESLVFEVRPDANFPRYEHWLAQAYLERGRLCQTLLGSEKDNVTAAYYIQGLEILRDLMLRFPKVDQYAADLTSAESEVENLSWKSNTQQTKQLDSYGWDSPFAESVLLEKTHPTDLPSTPQTVLLDNALTTLPHEPNKITSHWDFIRRELYRATRHASDGELDKAVQTLQFTEPIVESWIQNDPTAAARVRIMQCYLWRSRAKWQLHRGRSQEAALDIERLASKTLLTESMLTLQLICRLHAGDISSAAAVQSNLPITSTTLNSQSALLIYANYLLNQRQNPTANSCAAALTQMAELVKADYFSTSQLRATLLASAWLMADIADDSDFNAHQSVLDARNKLRKLVNQRLETASSMTLTYLHSNPIARLQFDLSKPDSEAVLRD